MKKSDLQVERRVLKLNRETVRLLDLKVAHLKTVAGGIVIISQPTVGTWGCC
jgi:hypothetical protein